MSFGVVAIDALAVILVLIGAPLTFRPWWVTAWLARRHVGQDQQGVEATGPEPGADPAGVASVLRMVGVMLMAFGVTGCAFANLIAYYSANSPN